MSDQISAVADSLSLHIFMSVKKREVRGLRLGEHWVEVTGRAFPERGRGWAGWHPAPAAQTSLALRCPRTRASRASVTVGHEVPLPPSHPSATSASPSTMSSLRPVPPGYWELRLEPPRSLGPAVRRALCRPLSLLPRPLFSAPCLLTDCIVLHIKYLSSLQDQEKESGAGGRGPNNPTEMTGPEGTRIFQAWGRSNSGRRKEDNSGGRRQCYGDGFSERPARSWAVTCSCAFVGLWETLSTWTVRCFYPSGMKIYLEEEKLVHRYKSKDIPSEVNIIPPLSTFINNKCTIFLPSVAAGGEVVSKHSFFQNKLILTLVVWDYALYYTTAPYQASSVKMEFMSVKCCRQSRFHILSCW